MTNKPTFFQPGTVVERDIPYIPTKLDVNDLRLDESGELTLLTEEQQRLIDTLPELQEDRRYSKKEITEAFRKYQSDHPNENNSNNNANDNSELTMPYTMIRYRGTPVFVYKKEIEKDGKKKNVGVLGEGSFGAVKLILGNGRLHTLKLQTKNIENAKEEYELLTKLGITNKKPLSERTTKENLNQYSIMMRLAPGITIEGLKDKEGKEGTFLISPALRLQLAIEVLRAIDKLHKEHGVLHRDLKDANIIIDVVNQRVELIDFGLAAEMNEEGKVQGTLKGSPVAYSPQLRAVAQQYSAEEKKTSGEKVTRERRNSGSGEKGTRERRNSGSSLVNYFHSIFDNISKGSSSGQRAIHQKADPHVTYTKETDTYAAGVLVADLLYLFDMPDEDIEYWKKQNYIYPLPEKNKDSNNNNALTERPLLQRYVNKLMNLVEKLKAFDKNNNKENKDKDSAEDVEDPIEQALNDNPLPRGHVDTVLSILHKLAPYNQNNTKQLTLSEAIGLLEEIKNEYVQEYPDEAKVTVYMLNVDEYLALRKENEEVDAQLAEMLIGKEVWFVDNDPQRDMKVYLEIKQALELKNLWVGDKSFAGANLSECESKLKQHLSNRHIPSDCLRFDIGWLKPSNSPKL